MSPVKGREGIQVLASVAAASLMLLVSVSTVSSGNSVEKKNRSPRQSNF